MACFFLLLCQMHTIHPLYCIFDVVFIEKWKAEKRTHSFQLFSCLSRLKAEVFGFVWNRLFFLVLILNILFINHYAFLFSIFLSDSILFSNDNIRCCFSAHLIFLFFSVSFMFVYPLIRIQWQIFCFVHSFCCFFSNLHFSIFFLPSDLVLGFY